MHWKTLLRLLSIVTAILSICLIGIAIFSFFEHESSTVTKSLLVPAILGILFFITMWLLVRKDRQKLLLTNREGFLFVSLSWLVAGLLGAIPFALSKYIPSYIDAVFETISGFTTTGASILTNIEALPRSLLLWRATTHWLGGMGIVVLTVAIFPLLGFGGLRLMEAEAPGPSVDRITPRIASTAKIFWFIYLGLTVAETLLLVFGGMTLYDAICHSFATLATGGFSTKNTSVGHFNSSYIDAVITVFMFLAGANFTLHFRFLSGKCKIVLKDAEFKAYFLIFTISSLLIAIDLSIHNVFPGFFNSLRFAGFQSSSILTTTGFATADFSLWPYASQIILLFLMFIGGCAGSTGGGIKVVRIIILAKMAFTEMRYLTNPKGVYSIFVNKKPIRKNIVYDTAAFVFLYLVIMIISFIVIGIGGYDITTSITATLASLGNIGPGFGLVGPALNYAFFPDWIKLWLAFIMLVGRLEVYTVLILFTRRFWNY